MNNNTTNVSSGHMSGSATRSRKVTSRQNQVQRKRKGAEAKTPQPNGGLGRTIFDPKWYKRLLFREPIGLIGLIVALAVALMQYLDLELSRTVLELNKTVLELNKTVFELSRTVNVKLSCEPIDSKSQVFFVKDGLYLDKEFEIETRCTIINRSPFRYSLRDYRHFTEGKESSATATFPPILRRVPQSAERLKRPNWPSYMLASDVLNLEAYETRVLYAAYIVPLGEEDQARISGTSMCSPLLSGESIEVGSIGNCVESFHGQYQEMSSSIVCGALKRGIFVRLGLGEIEEVHAVSFSMIGRDGESYISRMSFAWPTDCR